MTERESVHHSTRMPTEMKEHANSLSLSLSHTHKQPPALLQHRATRQVRLIELEYYEWYNYPEEVGFHVRSCLL